MHLPNTSRAHRLEPPFALSPRLTSSLCIAPCALSDRYSSYSEDVAAEAKAAAIASQATAAAAEATAAAAEATAAAAKAASALPPAADRGEVAAEAESDVSPPAAPVPPPAAEAEVVAAAPAATEPPPPIASPEANAISAAAGRRRSRRKSVVTRADLSLCEEEEEEAEPPLPPPAQDDNAEDVFEDAIEAEGPKAAATAAPAATAEAPMPTAATAAAVSAAPSEAEAIVIPVDASLQALSTPSDLLALAVDLAIDASADALPAAAASSLSSLFAEIGEIASVQASAKGAGKRPKGKGAKKGAVAGGVTGHSVRFATHDLSCLNPPKPQRPGSGDEQQAIVERLAGLVRTQRALLPTAHDGVRTVDRGAAEAADAVAVRQLLGRLGRLLGDLAAASALSAELRHAARFYSSEVDAWARQGTPLLWRRTGELLSSSLRLHLSAIFSEEEDAAHPDPSIKILRQRVGERAAAFGSPVGADMDAFSSVITTNLLALHRHVAAVAPTSAARSALLATAGTSAASAAAGLTAADEEGGAAVVHDLPADVKESVLGWANAHSLLFQIFGPREPLNKMMKSAVNAPHFEKLARLAAIAADLEGCDEAYLAPLRDVPQMQRDLHADAALSKAAHDALLVFSMNAKRRDGRPSRGRG